MKTHLENKGMELKAEAGGAVGACTGVGKESKGEGVKGMVCEERVGVEESVGEEEKGLMGEGTKGVTTDDVVKEE